jgi:hypothetical protein
MKGNINYIEFAEKIGGSGQLLAGQLHAIGRTLCNYPSEQLS